MNNPLDAFKKPMQKTEQKAEAVKEAVKEEIPLPVQMQVQSSKPKDSDSTPTILVTHEDAYIHERMKAQPQSLEEIDVQVERKIVPNVHRLSLPQELRVYEDRYAFRWIGKRKLAIDRACNVIGWMLVNKTYFPDLPNYLFTVNKSIEEGDMILAFMPRKKAESIREAPGNESRARVGSTIGAHKENPNYYVPKDDETDEVIGL